MRHLTGWSAALLLYNLPAIASAKACESYVGQTVAVQTFDAAVARVASITAKKKGETAAHYESRKAAALTTETGVLLIAKGPEARKYFQFDANAQKLGIVEYAFQNKYFNSKKAFLAAGYGGIPTGTNYESVIEQTNKGPDSGPQQRNSKVIYERPAPYNEDDWVTHLFPAAAPKPHFVGVISMTPAEFTALKPTLKLAFVVKPKAPFFISGDLKYRATPWLVEIDVAEHFQVLIADFQCGLVLTDAGKVLGAYPTE